MSSNARVTALKYLKGRSRSEFEIRSKLASKKFDQEEINQAIEYCISINLLDDRAFTKSWIAYRLARPFGFKRIAAELRQKGIAKEIIDEQGANFKEDSDDQAVLDLALRRASRMKNIDPAKKKKRIFDFLLRRGYSPEIIYQALKKI